MAVASTGIKGLDSVLEGGFMCPSTVIVSGLPGTGKSIFLMQSAFNAAASGEHVSLFLFNNSKPIRVINQFISRFSFYDDRLAEQNMITVYKIDLEAEEDGGLGAIRRVLEYDHPDRIIVDYTALQKYGFKDPELFVGEVSELVQDKGIIAYFAVNTDYNIADIPLSRYSDEMIHLSYETQGSNKSRFIDVIKSHLHLYMNRRFSFSISDDGIVVNTPALQNVNEIVNAIESIRKKSKIKLFLGVGTMGVGLILLTAVPVPDGSLRTLITALGAILITGGIYFFASPRI